MALVLCTGDDRTLLKTRRLILERDGHKVITATNQQEVTDACKHHKFAVAVIGQRLPLQSKQQIFDVIRQNCKAAKILELYSPFSGKTCEQADSWLAVPADVPQELAERVSALAGSKSSPQKAKASPKAH